MNLFHLKYFIKLAELEHYTKASKELNITQPSLSNAISSLEDEILVKLFEKKGRNVVLTKSGKIFFKIIKSALDNIDEAVNYVQKISSGNGVINIGFLQTLITTNIIEFCKKFKDSNKNKDIRFNFHNNFTDKLLLGLKSGDYDVIFTSKTDKDDSIQYIPITTQDLVLIVPDNHELANRDNVLLKDITSFDFISFNKKNCLHNLIMNNFKRIDKYPKVLYTADDEPLVIGLVGQHLGIAIIPNIPILDDLNIKKIEIKDIEQNRFFYMAYLKNNGNNIPVVYDFINYISDHKLKI
ncbi:LysR family transcriptional regulator [Gemella sp. GH3]|uniref:LysR family transcriptional regulator n=1 Tax=unclassified Gemella TaxID=2624949 RepID=UPI0015CFF747|nr:MULTISPECIES: LysR family transcriptional regulator [unclassified Gemella]MBF0714195.1 LysR family transcriptional regulator [Gemella sp. GH3.1]NYS51147.1 LysR family transcriptional regulator [Gemella sp. GH3]